MRLWSFILIFFCVKSAGQTVGGKAVFNFVKQPNSAQLSALGGVNISNITNDVSMSFHNPALLRSEMHRTVSASFNAFVAGIKNYSLSTAYHDESSATTLGFGLNYFNYGNIAQADASGNELGTFRPHDYVIHFSASRKHKENWFYGATLKYISSQYAQYRSSGVALDIGLIFADTSKHLQASIVVKNMGSQLKTYDGGRREELPFDLQAGVTKRLKNAPLQFSITAHNLHRFNIYYSDTTFLFNEGVDDFRNKKFTASKILSHLVVATQFFIRDKFEVTAGYNFLRRRDLNTLNAANGLNGVTLGGGLLLKNLDVRFASGFYQQNTFNQLSINFRL